MRERPGLGIRRARPSPVLVADSGAAGKSVNQAAGPHLSDGNNNHHCVILPEVSQEPDVKGPRTKPASPRTQTVRPLHTLLTQWPGTLQCLRVFPGAGTEASGGREDNSGRVEEHSGK